MTSGLNEEEIARVRQLLDRQQIIEGVYRYARGIDRADSELFKSVFWEDGRFDGGPADGLVHEVSDNLINDVVAHRFCKSQHLFGNILIEFASSGRQAHVESYAVAYHQTHPTRESILDLIGAEHLAEHGGPENVAYDLVMGLRYVDLWEKRGDIWKVSLRKLVPDWSTVQVSSTLVRGGIMDHLKWAGLRGASDPLYQAGQLERSATFSED